MIKVGDIVYRYFGGIDKPMELKVTAIDDELIHCGPWTFDKEIGFEVDDDLGWGRQENGEIITGTYISTIPGS